MTARFCVRCRYDRILRQASSLPLVPEPSPKFAQKNSIIHGALFVTILLRIDHILFQGQNQAFSIERRGDSITWQSNRFLGHCSSGCPGGCLGELPGGCLGECPGESLGELPGKLPGEPLGGCLGECLREPPGESLGELPGKLLGECPGRCPGKLPGRCPGECLAPLRRGQVPNVLQ
jgi:hypothetical protein